MRAQMIIRSRDHETIDMGETDFRSIDRGRQKISSGRQTWGQKATRNRNSRGRTVDVERRAKEDDLRLSLKKLGHNFELDDLSLG